MKLGQEMDESCSSWRLPMGYLSAFHFCKSYPRKNSLSQSGSSFREQQLDSVCSLVETHRTSSLVPPLRNFPCHAAPPPWNFFCRFLSFKNFIIILSSVSAGMVAVAPCGCQLYDIIKFSFCTFFFFFFLFLPDFENHRIC